MGSSQCPVYDCASKLSIQWAVVITFRMMPLLSFDKDNLRGLLNSSIEWLLWSFLKKNNNLLNLYLILSS